MHYKCLNCTVSELHSRIIFFLINKNKKQHTVGTAPNSNSNIVERDKLDTTITQIHHRHFYRSGCTKLGNCVVKSFINLASVTVVFMFIYSIIMQCCILILFYSCKCSLYFIVIQFDLCLLNILLHSLTVLNYHLALQNLYQTLQICPSWTQNSLTCDSRNDATYHTNT